MDNGNAKMVMGMLDMLKQMKDTEDSVYRLSLKIERDMSELKQTMSEVKQDMTEINQHLDNIEFKLDSLDASIIALPKAN